MTQQIKYKRVLLKLSGESLMGSDPFGINHDTIVQTVGEIAEVVKWAYKSASLLAVAASSAAYPPRRAAWTAHRRLHGHDGNRYECARPQRCLRKPSASKRACNPHFPCSKSPKPMPAPKPYNTFEEAKSSSSPPVRATVLYHRHSRRPARAEMNCDVMLKATNVDGVYTADPKKDPSATRYETITFDEALNKTSRSWTRPPSPSAANANSTSSSSASPNKVRSNASLSAKTKARWFIADLHRAMH